MKRVLTELTQECELTAQMYISGLEKKEIASLKYKAVSTINNQLQEAFQKLNVKTDVNCAVSFMNDYRESNLPLISLQSLEQWLHAVYCLFL